MAVEHTRDVVGVGALNIDLIAGASALGPLPAEPGSGAPVLERISREAGISPPLEPCTERLVGERTVRAALRCMAGVPLTPVPGGSAFNTVHALARLGAGLRLGYVGVAGRSPVAGVSAAAALDALGVDRRMVCGEPGRLSGVCLSLYAGGERTLVTHTGANDGMAGHLRERFADVSGYLAGSRAVHVTSFLDPDGGVQLHRVLAEVRRRSPGTLICFDPGHVWSADPPPAVRAVAALSDYVLVNRRELADLRPLLPEPAGAVVVKHPDRVEVRRGGRVATYPHQPLPDAEVEDATGAGDVFAAGLIAGLALAAPRSGKAGRARRVYGDSADGCGAGVRLGMALARHKLRHIGTQGHEAFAGITREHLGDR